MEEKNQEKRKELTKVLLGLPLYIICGVIGLALALGIWGGVGYLRKRAEVSRNVEVLFEKYGALKVDGEWYHTVADLTDYWVDKEYLKHPFRLLYAEFVTEMIYPENVYPERYK